MGRTDVARLEVNADVRWANNLRVLLGRAVCSKTITTQYGTTG